MPTGPDAPFPSAPKKSVAPVQTRRIIGWHPHCQCKCVEQFWGFFCGGRDLPEVLVTRGRERPPGRPKYLAHG